MVEHHLVHPGGEVALREIGERELDDGAAAAGILEARVGSTREGDGADIRGALTIEDLHEGGAWCVGIVAGKSKAVVGAGGV